MEISRLVARLISAVYICGGLGVLFGRIDFGKIAEDFERSPALTFISGSLTVMAGVALARYHNLWVRDWTVLITIISWLILAGGAIIVIFPGSLSILGRYYRRSPAWGIFMICFGLLLGYFGWFR